MDEQQAIHRLKNGDIGGLEYLVTFYQVKAVRTAYLITRDIGLAEDVVQDVFLNVHRAISGFDANLPFEPWLLRSVVNASLREVQKLNRYSPTWNERDESVEMRLAEMAESVEEQFESIELQNQIWKTMQHLSPRQIAVLVQRYFLGMTEREMMDVSGAAAGTIKWLLNEARKRLRMLWESRMTDE